MALQCYQYKNHWFQSFVQDRVDSVRELDVVAATTAHLRFEEAHKILAKRFADSIGGDPGQLADLKLGAQIASGQMRGCDTIYSTMRYLGARADALLAGKSRQSVSRPVGLSDAQVEDAGFHLSQLCKSKAGMRKFGYNANTIPTLNLDIPNIPNFFCAIEKPGCIQRSIATALRRLKIPFNRLGLLTFDDTNFTPGQCWVMWWGGGFQMVPMCSIFNCYL